MIDGDSTQGCNHNGRPRVGQTVELTRGILVGLRGVLDSFRDPQKCLLRMNVAQRGVLLMINADAVRECPSQPATACSSAEKDDAGALTDRP
jgi:hypothetical protein